MDQYAEYALNVVIVVVTLYILVRVALAYLFPKNTG